MPKKSFDLEVLRQKALAVLETMDPRGVTERFSYLDRHFWVTKRFSRGAAISACICAKCTARPPIA